MFRKKKKTEIFNYIFRDNKQKTEYIPKNHVSFQQIRFVEANKKSSKEKKKKKSIVLS